jgi:dethiobiotin synthetase
MGVRTATDPESGAEVKSTGRGEGSRPRVGLFITGTDTGVGKTHVALALVRGLVRSGLRIAAMKPVAAGATVTPEGLRNDDALQLAAAANVPVPYESLNPYCLSAPVSPHIAAEEAGIVIDPAVICREFERLAQRVDGVVVEGAGGWLAPIGPTQTMEDVALALRLPVLMVVGLRLGCLSHALLTARAVRASGLPLAHWVANEIDLRFEQSRENLERLSAELGPPLAVVPHSPSSGDILISVSL